MDSGISEPRTAVIVYVAQLIPRLPMQRVIASLLKEYLPVARAVAYNELLVMRQLTGLPEDKHMVRCRMHAAACMHARVHARLQPRAHGTWHCCCHRHAVI